VREDNDRNEAQGGRQSDPAASPQPRIVSHLKQLDARRDAA